MAASTIQVLLVEDNPTDAMFVREELADATGAAFALVHVETLGEALQRLKAKPFDVVLLDLGLPDGDGLEAFERLHAAVSDVPVIILSGRNDESLAMTAVHAGAQDYLVKGIGDQNGLARAIRYAIERSRAQAALQESDARFHQVVRNIHEALWLVEADTRRVVFVSPRYAEIWGDSAEALRASPDAWLQSVHPDDRSRVEQGAAARDRGNGHSETSRIVRRDGAVRWIRHRTFAARDGSGAVRRLVAVAEDTTERKKLEEQFLRSQRMEAIGTLAGGVAHDLNNILAPVLMTAELLTARAPLGRDRELLAMMAQGAQRAADTVRQLLLFSRGAEGQRGVVQPRHLLKEMAGIMRETFPREIRIVEEPAADLWPVIADATQLHQVLMNLCVNARDAMPNGGKLTIGMVNCELRSEDIGLHADAREGRYAVLSVADTGHGIPPDIINRIFDPFFTTKEIGHGSGLGLSTVVGIMRSHGGFITVASEPGRGTVFKSYLPAAAESALSALVPSSKATSMGRGELVLVVDDEPAIREATREILEANQYSVLSAGDGREALDVFVRERANVRLVLTDVMMPVMNGPALVRALRELEPRLKVIAASGLDNQARRDELAALGVTEILMKPFKPAQLLELVRRQLATGRSGMPWEPTNTGSGFR